MSSTPSLTISTYALEVTKIINVTFTQKLNLIFQEDDLPPTETIVVVLKPEELSKTLQDLSEVAQQQQPHEVENKEHIISSEEAGSPTTERLRNLNFNSLRSTLKELPPVILSLISVDA